MGNDKAQDEAVRATADYEKRYNPSAAAVDAYKRAMTRQLRESYGQQRETERSYSDLYQQARRQATRQGSMSNISGFGGGRAEGAAARASAAEIQALSNIASQREGALRQLAEQRQAVESNAMLEAQQADQYERAMRAARAQESQQILDIVKNVTDYSSLPAAKRVVLRDLGIRNQEDLTKFLSLAPGEVVGSPESGMSKLSELAIDAATSNPLVAGLNPKNIMLLLDLIQGQKAGTTKAESGLYKSEGSAGEDLLTGLGRFLGIIND